MTAMFVNGSKRNEQFPQRTFHRCFLPRFGSFGKSSFRGEEFQKSTNQKQELPVVAIFVNESGRNEQSFIEDLPQMHPTKFQFIWQSSFRGGDFFRNHPIRTKNCLWWPYLLTNRDEMSNHNRGLSMDACYQVSVHLAKRFQRRRIYFFQQFSIFY